MNPEYQKTYGTTSSWNEDEKKMYKGGANFTGYTVVLKRC